MFIIVSGKVGRCCRQSQEFNKVRKTFARQCHKGDAVERSLNSVCSQRYLTRGLLDERHSKEAAQVPSQFALLIPSCTSPIIAQYCAAFFQHHASYNNTVAETMSEQRSLYLAKSRASPSQRAHFGIFYPHSGAPDHNLEQAYSSPPCKGTIIHVVGEPLMSGFTLQFKRNCNEASLPDLKELIFLGRVELSHLHIPNDETYIEEDVPRARIERAATSIPTPPKGQDLRLPVDGVSRDL